MRLVWLARAEPHRVFENDLDTLSKRLNEAALNAFFPSAFGAQAPDARPGIE